MREIKFRQPLLDRQRNFIQFHYWGIFPDSFTGREMSGCEKGDDQQFTGLKDKNGIEMYEGDLFDYGGFGVVEVKLGWYDNGEQYEDRDAGYGWYLEGRSKKHPYRHGIDYLDSTVCVGKFRKKVIGSIYENPELVKKAK